jgi:uncharacterized protein YdcH (DUF465 family)
MKKAMEIKSEIDKTESRIAELEMERERQTVAVKATEKAFVDGKADVAKLNDAQGKLSLYERSIESLRAIYQRLKSDFEKQFEVDSRVELLERMKATAVEVEPLVNSYLDTKNEFHEIVSQYAEKLVAKSQTYQNKQVEYQTIIAELKPTDAEIQSLGLEQKTLTLAATSYINHPPVEYGEAIKLAENLLAAKLNRAAQAKRQSNYNSMKTAA